MKLDFALYAFGNFQRVGIEVEMGNLWGKPTVESSMMPLTVAPDPIVRLKQLKKVEPPHTSIQIDASGKTTPTVLVPAPLTPDAAPPAPPVPQQAAAPPVQGSPYGPYPGHVPPPPEGFSPAPGGYLPHPQQPQGFQAQASPPPYESSYRSSPVAPPPQNPNPWALQTRGGGRRSQRTPHSKNRSSLRKRSSRYKTKAAGIKTSRRKRSKRLSR